MRASLVLVLTFVASPAWAQQSIVGGTHARITNRAVIGGSTFGEVMRIVGSPTVSSGTGTMNPAVIDTDGDVLEDSNTTVSTAGAWTWGAAGSFTSTLNVGSTLNVNGFITSSSGTILRLGHQTRVETTAPVFVWKETDQGTDGKNVRMYSENGVFSLDLLSDAETTSGNIFAFSRAGLVPGDWRWGAGLGTIRPENNGGSSLGTTLKKYFTINAWELRIDTLVAQEKIATIGGRVIVAPTTKLVRDLPSADTLIYVEHNQMRTGDVLWLEGDGLFEKMTISGSYLDCNVAGNCVIPNGYRYSVTRNLDGTGANDWYAGDAVVNEGVTGDGYIDLYSDRSATAVGYYGQVISDFPIAYWRMDETGAGFSSDQMVSVGNLSETGTQSAGLGVASCYVGPAACAGPFDPIWQNNTGGAGTGYLRKNNAPGLQIVGDLTLEFIALHSGATAGTIVSKGFEGEYHLQVETTGALTFCQDIPPLANAVYQCISTAAAAMPVGTINHYAVVRDMTSTPRRVLFYRDGTLIHSGTFATATAASVSTIALTVGANDGGTSIFYGGVDEVAIYNYAVSGDRLAIHATARTSTALSKATFGPTLCGNVRTGTAAFDSAERWCLGNLAGTYGYSSVAATYGFAAGPYAATSISADATNGFRILNAGVAKFAADTSGNLSLTGNLTLGTAGIFSSGTKPDCTIPFGTGIYMAYNAGTPVFCVGTPGDYVSWDGTDLTISSNNFSVRSGGVFVSPRTVDTFGTEYGYNFDSAKSGSDPSLWSYETAFERGVRLNNAATHSGLTTRIAFTVDDEDLDTAGLTIDTGLSASSNDSGVSVSGINFTVSSNNIVVRGNTGLTTTIVLPCGTTTYTSGVLTNKGTC